MGFGGPSPPPVPMPPPSAHPPVLGSATSALAAQNAKQRAAGAEGMGFDDTIATSPEGVKEKPNTQRATLLGQ